MKKATNVVPFPLYASLAARGPGIRQDEPAVVIILPVIWIERFPDDTKPKRRRRRGG